MSKYNTVVTQFTSLEHLCAALKEKGWPTFEVHAEAQTLYDWHGQARPEKANLIIRRKYIDGAANDIGFVLDPDGTYRAIVSDYDRSKHSRPWNAAFLGQLAQEYQTQRTIAHNTSLGLVFRGRETVTAADGRPKVRLSFVRSDRLAIGQR